MALPDIIAGLVWVMIALLFVRRGGATAAYSAAVAGTWFASELMWQASMWHRFALMVLLICAPRWLPRTWTARVTLIGQLVAAVAVAPWASPLGAVLLSAAFVVAAAIEQPRRGVPRWAAIAVAGCSFAIPVVLGLGPGSSAAVGWGYAGAMIVVGLLVAGDRGVESAGSQRLDLLVELESTSLPGSSRDRAAADRLRAKHEELLAGLNAGVAQLQASRRRLAEARLTASRELREDLEARVIAPLAALAARAAPDVADGTGQFAVAREHLRIARADIEAIGEGLGPRSLENGLAAALHDLATSSPVPVALAVDESGTPLADEIAARTAYLVCAEALANTAKHAQASRVALEALLSSEGLMLRIADDGTGGADFRAGTGLTGMNDRVEAVGGSLRISSDSAGTVVTAWIPVRHDSASLPEISLPEVALR